MSRFVFISGGAFTAQINKFLNETDATVLEKPLDFNGLTETIEQLIAEAEKREPLRRHTTT